MFELSGKQYNAAKWLVGIVSPAFIALYLTLGDLWNRPIDETQKVVGTVAAVTLFIGVVLGISTKKYNEDNTPPPEGL